MNKYYTEQILNEINNECEVLLFYIENLKNNKNLINLHCAVIKKHIVKIQELQEFLEEELK